MSDEPPTRPADLPTDIVDTLDGYSRDQLVHVARYAEALAEYRAREARTATASEQDETDEPPEDVPSKATVTIKEIRGNRYRYWQWRDGEKIKSKYIGPAGDAD